MSKIDHQRKVIANALNQQKSSEIIKELTQEIERLKEENERLKKLEDSCNKMFDDWADLDDEK